MILLLNILCSIVVLSIWNYSKRLIPFAANHLNLYSIVWGSLVIGYQFVGFSVVRPLDVVFFYTVWVFFLIGSIIPLNTKRASSMRQLYTLSHLSRIDLKILKTSFVFLFTMFVISNLGLLSLEYIKDFSFENMARARIEHSLDDIRANNLFYTIFGTNMTLILPIAVLLRSRNFLSKGFSLFVLIVFILVSVAGFTRAPLFAFFVTLITSIFLFQSEKTAWRILVFGFFVIISFFSFSSSILSANQLDWSFWDDIKVYYFGGISALTNVMEGKYLDVVRYDVKLYSFDFILYPANSFGLVNSYPSIVREYDVYLPTNVYTYLDAFILDFGLLGGVLGSFIIGFLQSSLLLMFRFLGFFALMLYVNYLYYLSFIFMNNEFIRFGALLFIIKVLVLFACHTTIKNSMKL